MKKSEIIEDIKDIAESNNADIVKNDSAYYHDFQRTIDGLEECGFRIIKKFEEKDQNQLARKIMNVREADEHHLIRSTRPKKNINSKKVDSANDRTKTKSYHLIDKLKKSTPNDDLSNFKRIVLTESNAKYNNQLFEVNAEINKAFFSKIDKIIMTFDMKEVSDNLFKLIDDFDMFMKEIDNMQSIVINVYVLLSEIEFYKTIIERLYGCILLYHNKNNQSKYINRVNSILEKHNIEVSELKHDIFTEFYFYLETTELSNLYLFENLVCKEIDEQVVNGYPKLSDLHADSIKNKLDRSRDLILYFNKNNNVLKSFNLTATNEKHVEIVCSSIFLSKIKFRNKEAYKYGNEIWRAINQDKNYSDNEVKIFLIELIRRSFYEYNDTISIYPHLSNFKINLKEKIINNLFGYGIYNLHNLKILLKDIIGHQVYPLVRSQIVMDQVNEYVDKLHL